MDIPFGTELRYGINGKQHHFIAASDFILAARCKFISNPFKTFLVQCIHVLSCTQPNYRRGWIHSRPQKNRVLRQISRVAASGRQVLPVFCNRGLIALHASLVTSCSTASARLPPKSKWLAEAGEREFTAHHPKIATFQ